MVEALPTRCTKDGVPWSWSTRLHSITEGEIEDRPMLETSQSMGSGIQLQSPKAPILSEPAPPKCKTNLCRYVPGSSGLDR